jgi:hypothetical protein
MQHVAAEVVFQVEFNVVALTYTDKTASHRAGGKQNSLICAKKMNPAFFLKKMSA